MGAGVASTSVTSASIRSAGTTATGWGGCKSVGTIADGGDWSPGLHCCCYLTVCGLFFRSGVAAACAACADAPKFSECAGMSSAGGANFVSVTATTGLARLMGNTTTARREGVPGSQHCQGS